MQSLQTGVLTFEDETGLVETIFSPQAYRCFCYMIDRTRPYILTGKVEIDFRALPMTVEKVGTISRLQTYTLQ